MLFLCFFEFFRCLLQIRALYINSGKQMIYFNQQKYYSYLFTKKKKLKVIFENFTIRCDKYLFMNYNYGIYHNYE